MTLSPAPATTPVMTFSFPSVGGAALIVSSGSAFCDKVSEDYDAA